MVSVSRGGADAPVPDRRGVTDPALRVAPLAPWLAGAWDEYVLRHPAGWFWHTTGWLAYQRAYAPCRSLSFAIVDDAHRIVAIAPLLLPDRTPGECSYAGGPLPVPLAGDQEAADLIEAEVERQAAAAGARGARMAGHPFGRPLVSPYWGEIFRPSGVAHRVVDLCDLKWSEVRSSYRSLIHRADREYNISFHSGTGSGAEAAFARYQEIHRRLYGGRPDETYRLQRDWLEAELAAVALAETGDVTWGGAYWFVYKGGAYYGSGAYAARDVSHAVVWRSLLALGARGVRAASLGWRGTAETDKERAIEFFKAGFGGRDVEVPMFGARW